jgi:membrane fusion protein (multidrug efflux system)
VTDQKSSASDNKSHRNHRLIPIIGSILFGIAVALTLYFWSSSRTRVSTDDAFIDGHIISIAPKVSGEVVAVHVTDNQNINANDILFEIDSRDFEAKLNLATADFAVASKAYERANALVTTGGVSKEERDRALADKQRSEALLTEAKLQLSYTRVAAPAAGRVTHKTVEKGTYLETGQTALSIVLNTLWITANYKETQLQKIYPGQSALMKVDAYPKIIFTGHVDSVQSGTGSRFSLFPAENASGNFVKVVQRVPVKIIFDHMPQGNYLLGPGMSVVPEIQTGKHAIPIIFCILIGLVLTALSYGALLFWNRRKATRQKVEP